MPDRLGALRVCNEDHRSRLPPWSGIQPGKEAPWRNWDTRRNVLKLLSGPSRGGHGVSHIAACPTFARSQSAGRSVNSRACGSLTQTFDASEGGGSRALHVALRVGVVRSQQRPGYAVC